MLANESGLLVCLLNRWHEEREELANPARSRGQLVMKMGGLENVPAAEERLRGEDLGGLRPFTLMAFDSVGERGWDWNGKCLEAARLEMPMCSSSFHFEEVAAARRLRYQELACARATGRHLLESYHADAEGGASAFTVRMCRSDAQTMSRSRVRVVNGGVQWWYWEEQGELASEPVLYEVSL